MAEMVPAYYFRATRRPSPNRPHRHQTGRTVTKRLSAVIKRLGTVIKRLGAVTKRTGAAGSRS